MSFLPSYIQWFRFSSWAEMSLMPSKKSLKSCTQYKGIQILTRYRHKFFDKNTFSLDLVTFFFVFYFLCIHPTRLQTCVHPGIIFKRVCGCLRTHAYSQYTRLGNKQRQAYGSWPLGFHKNYIYVDYDSITLKFIDAKSHRELKGVVPKPWPTKILAWQLEENWKYIFT